MGKILITGLLGIAIILVVLFDVFQTIIVPRISTRKFRLAPFLVQEVMWPGYKWFVMAPVFSSKRNSLLEAFAPVTFIVLMVIWLTLMVTGYAVVLWSLRASISPMLHNFFDAFYFAGSSVLTLGFGDVVAFGIKPRCVVLLAAVSGLVFMALAVSYLFSLQSLVQQREQTVSTLISRAGAPASGLVLLLRYKELNILPSLYSNFLNWEAWIAGILESHRAYPLLLYFRSSTPIDSWLSVLGAMLDASTLIITSITDVSIGEAELFYWIGCSTVKSISSYIGLETETHEKMEFETFANGLALLKSAGFHVKDEAHAWKLFKVRRSGYQPYLKALCQHLAAPNQTWIQELAISQISVKDSIKDSVFQP